MTITHSGSGRSWMRGEGLQDFMFQCFGNGFRAAIDMKFAVDILKMFFYRVDSDAGSGGDHFVGISFHQQIEHFFFPGGKIEGVLCGHLGPEMLKYSQATTASIEVLSEGNKLTMKVADNGIGFNYSQAQYGNGLSNMQQRAAVWKDHLSIESSPGNGASIFLELRL